MSNIVRGFVTKTRMLNHGNLTDPDVIMQQGIALAKQDFPKTQFPNITDTEYDAMFKFKDTPSYIGAAYASIPGPPYYIEITYQDPEIKNPECNVILDNEWRVKCVGSDEPGTAENYSWIVGYENVKTNWGGDDKLLTHIRSNLDKVNGQKDDFGIYNGYIFARLDDANSGSCQPVFDGEWEIDTIGTAKRLVKTESLETYMDSEGSVTSDTNLIITLLKPQDDNKKYYDEVNYTLSIILDNSKYFLKAIPKTIGWEDGSSWSAPSCSGAPKVSETFINTTTSRSS